MPPPWLLEEPRALGKVLFLDCQLEWNVPEETPKACIPFLLPSLPLSPGNIPDPVTDSWRVLSSIGGATLKKEAGRGDPTTRRHGAYMAFRSSSSTEAPHLLGAVGIVLLQEDLLGSGGHEPMQRGIGTSDPWGRAH